MSEKKAKGASSILKDALALCAITLVAAVLLGFVNELTKDKIAEQNAAAKVAAYREVFPAAVVIDTEDASAQAKAGASQDILKQACFDGVTIDEVGVSKDASGNVIGYVMNISTKGYGSMINMSMGYTVSGEITGISFITLEETPGLGMRADEEEFKGQFTGRTADSLVLTKTGAANDNEIDAISSATITSTAVTKAVNAGIYFANDLIASGIGGAGNE